MLLIISTAIGVYAPRQSYCLLLLLRLLLLLDTLLDVAGDMSHHATSSCQ